MFPKIINPFFNPGIQPNDHVKGNEEDKEKCEVESCGEWMPWAEWSQCLSIPQNYPGLRLTDLHGC